MWCRWRIDLDNSNWGLQHVNLRLHNCKTSQVAHKSLVFQLLARLYLHHSLSFFNLETVVFSFKKSSESLARFCSSKSSSMNFHSIFKYSLDQSKQIHFPIVNNIILYCLLNYTKNNCLLSLSLSYCSWTKMACNSFIVTGKSNTT